MNIPATLLLALLGASEAPDAADLGIDYAEQSVRAIEQVRMQDLDRDLYRARPEVRVREHGHKDHEKEEHDGKPPHSSERYRH